MKNRNIVTIKTRQPGKTKQNNEKAAHGHGGTGNSTHLTILPRASPENNNHDLKGYCRDHRPLVNKFLEGFYGGDIVCEINYCSVCNWTTSDGAVSLQCCPVCGQAIKNITLIIHREIFAFDDTVLEIRSGD